MNCLYTGIDIFKVLIVAEPTPQQVFGTGFTQTATTFTISKADLASVGLTADASNRAEQLFVAVLLKAAASLNPTAQQSNPDIQITVESSFPSIVFRNDQNYRQSTYTVALQKLDTATSIDPDDY
jgi:hypothetical protein